MTSNHPAVVLSGVSFSYDDTVALSVAHVSIDLGERVFILGKSGSGKTTLSGIIKGRLHPQTGSVDILGQGSAWTNRPLQKRIAMVDQEFNLVSRMTLIETVLSGALGRTSSLSTLFGRYPKAEWQKAEGILKEVGLEELGNRRIDTLSGGQKQRAAIARALMQQADILLADEPISNLDPELAEDALDLLVECVQRRNIALLVNLHQPRLARKFATRVLGLVDGKIHFDGNPESLSPTDEEFIYTSATEETPTTTTSAHDQSATTMA
jgi:phosphonate transport system ATP-binding protein